MDLGSTLVALLIALVIKATVMGFSTWILLYLAEAVGKTSPLKMALAISPRETNEMRIIWIGLLFFWISEMTCGIEVYILLHSSPAIGITHAISSAISAGLLLVGMFRIIDERVIHMFSGARSCTGIAVCKTCTFKGKPLRQQVCTFDRFIKLTLAMAILFTIPVFFASTETMYADVSRYVLPFESLNRFYDQTVVPLILKYNANYKPSGKAYSMAHSVLFVEYRLLPLISLVCFSASGALLAFKRKQLAIELLLIGVGFLSFGYFQVITNLVTGDILMGGLLHEVVELGGLIAFTELMRKFYPQHGAFA